MGAIAKLTKGLRKLLAEGGEKSLDELGTSFGERIKKTPPGEGVPVSDYINKGRDHFEYEGLPDDYLTSADGYAAAEDMKADWQKLSEKAKEYIRKTFPSIAID